ncbi:MAG TPA: glycosyltransferase, partial [Sunxiuqinia sp.]|nr:glycosyltransferase [Sunxiuqinia sp.]
KVNKVCVAYENMERYFPKGKLVLTGNPVRQNLIKKVNKEDAYKAFKLEPGKPVILILGGSLGARTINESVLANLNRIYESGIQVLWQCGTIYYNNILERLNGRLRSTVHLHEFLSQMDLAFAAADLVISRAGAATISELCLLGKASILVPSPNVAEDHQTKNAMALVEKEAAVMVKDGEAVQDLFVKALDLVLDSKKLNELAANSKKMARPNATADIVDVILKEIEK